MDPGPQETPRDHIMKATKESDVIITPVSSVRYDDTTAYLKHYSNKLRIGISNFASIYSDKLLTEGICDLVIHKETEMTSLEIVDLLQC